MKIGKPMGLIIDISLYEQMYEPMYNDLDKEISYNKWQTIYPRIDDDKFPRNMGLWK